MLGFILIQYTANDQICCANSISATTTTITTKPPAILFHPCNVLLDVPHPFGFWYSMSSAHILINNEAKIWHLRTSHSILHS